MKFVIHHHVTHPDHYDLMIEKGDVLHTWQIPEYLFNDFIQSKKIEVKKIQDHRKKYLDYEGPVSCDRGMVKIYDSGEYIENKWDDEIIILLIGKKLEGKLSISKNNQKYLLRYSAT